MGRWSQFEEDAYRLPEGFVRVAYDADTEVYTFRDGKGALYKGAPRAEYGILTPIPDKDSEDSLGTSRPGAFESDRPQKPVGLVSPDSAPRTFHDILPPDFITTPSASADNLASTVHGSEVSGGSAHTSVRVKFIEAARRAALPKIQGVAETLRRSKTAPSSRHTTNEFEESEHLLRRGSSTLSRNISQGTTHSNLSIETRMSVNSRRV